MIKNFFQHIPDSLKEEIQQVFENKTLRIERIVSTGQVSTEGFWYDQAEEEWVMVLQGEARIAYADGSEIELQTGSYLHIPAHCLHRVTYTTLDPACIWLALFWKSQES